MLKFFKIIIIFSIICLQLEAHNLEEIRTLIKTYSLESLAESGYHELYPDNLPYSDCLLFSNSSFYRQKKFDFFIGKLKHNPLKQIFCYSKKYSTAFTIPVEIQKDTTVGLAFSFNDHRILRFYLKNMDGQTLQNIFGDYSGLNGGLGIGTNFSGSILKNKNVWLTINESLSYSYFELNMSFRKITICPRQLQIEEIYKNDFNLTDPPQKPYIKRTLRDLARYSIFELFFKFDPHDEKSLLEHKEWSQLTFIKD